MQKLTMWCIAMTFVCLSLQSGNAYSENMIKQNFTYNLNETIEIINASSVLQCARRCKVFAQCSVFELQEENSTCVILKSATITTETRNTQQYMIKPTCDEGWFTYSSSCYLVTPSKYSFDVCESNCETYGGHLATVTSAQENDFIQGLRKGASVWIGGRRSSVNAPWTWVTGEKWEYRNWDEETKTTQICVRYQSSTSEWDDFRCNRNFKCVCEKD